MKVCSLFTGLSLLAASSASAQLDVNFNANPPYDPSLEVSGQGGWTINPGTPSDLSYFQQVGSENWGSLGGLYATPAGSNATLSKPVGVPFAGSGGLLTNFFIQSSANAPADPGDIVAGRDTFGFSFQGSSQSVFDLRFIPDGTDPDLMNIWWGSPAGGQALTFTNNALFDDSMYSLRIDFAVNGADLDFFATLGGTNAISFNGTITGAAGLQWDSFDVVWDLTNAGNGGSNAIVLQGLSGVPEPSSAMGSLLAGMMGLSVATRRRRRA
jgi:hypothetical protein